MKIADICKQFNIPAATLRYYEDEGLLDPVPRNSSGHREYGEKELRRINFIQCMKKAGMSIEGIKQYVELYHEGDHTIDKRKDILENQLSLILKQIEDLESSVTYLKEKIERYDEISKRSIG